MSRILLVDDSPHAQRMGERILSEEGYEVVTVSNTDSALIRLDDVDPDVVLADTVMPGRTGYDICQYLKMSPRHRYVRVILTAGVLEIFDEERARQVQADGTLKKPFEASALLAAVKPLAEAAGKDRASAAPSQPGGMAAHEVKPEVPFVAVIDAEHLRAAVTVALDASLDTMVEQITHRVLAALRAHNADGRLDESRSLESQVPSPEPLLAPVRPEIPKPAAPAPPTAATDQVRRVTPLRIRSGSILGLDISRPETPEPDPE